MVFTVTISLPTKTLNQRCGLKHGQDGSLSLEARFLTDQLKTWRIQLLNLFRVVDLLSNYYMYHGGTNFGRTAGGPFIATSYDYDAPLDENVGRASNSSQLRVDT
ncbi:hypothetical protein M8C21_026797 [Ambrosia artemisiifolia]|uniref:beta-galactosidase n=1 Tax=Ambrosia artemisiifolia TaxID=4212 RepID=A0AAD5DE80_AMBAR|nr:hypothetical protein M8C21_026797 [Ambrosia artemisiifolia]